MSWQGTEHVDLVRLGGRPTTKHVFGAVGHHHDSRTGRSEFYAEQIAESTELGESTVRRELKWLQQAGFIRELVKGNRSRPSVFEIVPPLLRRRTPLAGSEIPLAGSKTPLAGSEIPLAPSGQTDAIRKEEVEVKQVEENHHSFAGLIAAWISIKDELKKRLPAKEWNSWARPLYLYRVRPQEGFVLFTLPANNRMVVAAKAKKALLLELLQPHGYRACSFAPYPDDYELGRLSREYPEIYEQLPDALKKRPPERVTA